MNNSTISKFRVGVELMEFFLISMGYEGSLYVTDYIFKTFSKKYYIVYLNYIKWTQNIFNFTIIHWHIKLCRLHQVVLLSDLESFLLLFYF